MSSADSLLGDTIYNPSSVSLVLVHNCSELPIVVRTNCNVTNVNVAIFNETNCSSGHWWRANACSRPLATSGELSHVIGLKWRANELVTDLKDCWHSDHRAIGDGLLKAPSEFSYGVGVTITFWRVKFYARWSCCLCCHRHLTCAILASLGGLIGQQRLSYLMDNAAGLF